MLRKRELANGREKSSKIERTFFGNHVQDCILIDELHALRATLADASNCIGTSNSSFTAGSRVKKSTLEVGVEFRVKFAVIAEHDSNRLVLINDAELQVSTEAVLQEISVIGRDLKTIRASDFHQCLIARLPREGMFQFLHDLQTVPWSREIGVEEDFAARDCSWMADGRNVHVPA